MHIWYCPQDYSYTNNNTTTISITCVHIFTEPPNMSFLITDMVDSPMYAVINNSMGSGSVTYECEGYETRLSDCMISTYSQETCHYALVNCVPETQVFVAQTSYDPKYGYYLTVQEADGNIRVCLQTNRVVTEPLHVHVETTHTNTTGNISHVPAIGRGMYIAYLSLHVIFVFIHIQVIMTTKQLLILSHLSHLLKEDHSNSVWRLRSLMTHFLRTGKCSLFYSLPTTQQLI